MRHPIWLCATRQVTPGTQENEAEARELIDALLAQLENPGYCDASFGVICLFEEQMRLVNDLVAERIPEELRSSHNLVVVNPDGFQGDERDVIYYSLSYDANGMDQSAISARQADRAHIQGMLNVAFTRAREEMHIYHTAPIHEFGMASGSGSIREWLEHCERVTKSVPRVASPFSRADSEFEVQVGQELSRRGIKVTSQFPSCGYFIDIVAELDGHRVAVECDGEVWHLDEHGNLKAEDLIRQDILERAGWTVLRVPYRGWQANRELQLDHIHDALLGSEESSDSPETTDDSQTGSIQTVTAPEAAVIQALKGGEKDRNAVLKSASQNLGRARLGPNLRLILENAVEKLVARKVVLSEESELFLGEQARNASFSSDNMPYEARRSYGRRRRYSRFRPRRW